MSSETLSKQQLLQQEVSGLLEVLPELRGVIVASTDGLAIAHSFVSSSIDPHRVAAMAATALGLGKRISSTLGTGTFTETSVAGADGLILIYASGSKGVLALIAPSHANLGLVHLEARDAANRVAQVL